MRLPAMDNIDRAGRREACCVRMAWLGGAALFQRRRGLAGTGLPPVPESVDQVLHGLARHVGIS
jgi:hypothetical protein